MVELAKAYLRSIIGIASMSLAIGYGMYLNQVAENVLLAYLAACVAMVLLDEIQLAQDKAEV